MSGEGLLYVLNEREQWFRKLYNSDEGKFLAQPMTYGEYEQIIETHPEYLDLRDFFRGTMVDRTVNYEYSNRTKMPDAGSDITYGEA